LGNPPLASLNSPALSYRTASPVYWPGTRVRILAAARGSQPWHAQIALSPCSASHFVDHQFNSLTRPAGIEKYRFIHGTIFLFKALIVRQHIDSLQLILLWCWCLSVAPGSFPPSAPASFARYGEIRSSRAGPMRRNWRFDLIVITGDQAFPFQLRAI